jgi:N-acetylneuraminic acid mutarotase
LALALASTLLASCGPNDSPTGPGGPSRAVAAAANTWSARAPLPTSRVSLAAAVINNGGQPILYAIGGDDGDGVTLDRVDAYDFAANSWTGRAPLPARLEETNGAVVIGGKIYLSGGRDLDNSSPGSDDGAPRRTLYVYSPAANSWTRKADMPEPSIAGVSGAINGQLYVLIPESAHFYSYDPATDTWMRRVNCPTGHFRGAAAVIQNQFYVAGGEKFLANGPRAVQQLHIYDPVTGGWKLRAPLPHPVFASAGARLLGQLYVVGGAANNRSRDYVQAYDPAANAWSQKTPLPTFRSSLAAANVVLGGAQRLVAVGGFGGSVPLRSNDLYTP